MGNSTNRRQIYEMLRRYPGSSFSMICSSSLYRPRRRAGEDRVAYARDLCYALE
ncbi:MAG: hypothetical protein R3C44_14165 [Chloroflexota bacterium]